MPCLQTLSGIARDCNGNVGGIKVAYIANKDDVAAITTDGGKVTAITMVDTAKFKKYNFKKNTGNFTSTLNSNLENGTSYVSTDIVLVFNRMETSKRVEIAALSQGELCVIVQDMNGALWLFGKENAVVASAGSGETGTAMADRNGYSITLQDAGSEWPFEVLATVLDGIVD